MSIQQSYDSWASQYDSNDNKTRDLEAKALREALSPISFQACLEIGCGTGKNTEWLLQKAGAVTAVDFSAEMLSKAGEKIHSSKVNFIQADINHHWNFTRENFDLISFSLVLEHIENLDHIFKEAAKRLNPNGYVYIGELHPFKQYAGSKARFDTEAGLHVLECYNHNISDFVEAAKKSSFKIIDLREYFDKGSQAKLPRVLVLLLQKIEDH